MLSRFQFGGAGADRGVALMIGLLLLAVLLPTAALLYFINVAVNHQRTAARQQLGEAYRGQLNLVRDRIGAFWAQRAADLDGRPETESPAMFFEHCVRDGLADSVIVLNAQGTPAYPSLPLPPRPDPTLQQPSWIEARALENTGRLEEASRKYAAIANQESTPSLAGRAAQASIRCLLGLTRTGEAREAIQTHFVGIRLAYADGLDGRLIQADEWALRLQLMQDHDKVFRDSARALHGLLANYSREIPSSQRLFLMDNLRAFDLGPELRTFPTYPAERLAERILSGGRATLSEPGLRLSGIGDVWKLVSPGKRVIALYGKESVGQAMLQYLEPWNSSGGPTFALTPPGQPLPPHQEWTAAGEQLPGWQLSLNLSAAGFSGITADHQIASYLWIGFLTIATAAALALFGGQLLRRQMRIAHLKTDLVAAVSHELKTPLASMKLLVESLLSGDQFEPKRTREYLELVARENSRLSRLIDNFLTFSRMERNRGRFDFARVRPETLAQTAVESVGGRYAVSVDVAPGLPPLYADEDALVTVLLNLLDNAFKYTKEDRRIDLRVGLSEGRVIFAVTDNGIGIPERAQRKIFRRFYQVDRQLARTGGGVGLGLSIVEFIVKAHNGAVSVVSRPGAGSTFTVFLPPSSSAVEIAA